MGIEPTTYSLGSTRVSNDIKSLAAKLRLSRLCCIIGLPVESKTSPRRVSDQDALRISGLRRPYPFTRILTT
jgi:hypothetical protein